MIVSRWTSRAGIAFGAAGLMLTTVSAAFAQAPQCTQATAGQRSCQGGVSCECVYESGGTASGQPEGYRWDCSVLQPRCEAPAAADSQTNTSVEVLVLQPLDQPDATADADAGSGADVEWVAPE